MVTCHLRPVGCAHFPHTSLDRRALPANPPSICGICPVRQDNNLFRVASPSSSVGGGNLLPSPFKGTWPNARFERGMWSLPSTKAAKHPAICSSIPLDIATPPLSHGIALVRLRYGCCCQRNYGISGWGAKDVWMGWYWYGFQGMVLVASDLLRFAGQEV